MDFIRIEEEQFDELKALQAAYKREIGEDAPTGADFDRLLAAMRARQILFFGCVEGDRLIGCCSVSPTFSTFDYRRGGVLEDFYILPDCRHKGVARKLVGFARKESGVSSLTVGCADCDLSMYHSLGFSLSLGHLLAYEEDAPESN